MYNAPDRSPTTGEGSRATWQVPVEDGETFLRGELSHGYRSLFEIYDEDVRRELDADLLGVLDEMQRTGGIFLERGSLCVKGRKPHGAAQATRR